MNAVETFLSNWADEEEGVHRLQLKESDAVGIIKWQHFSLREGRRGVQQCECVEAFLNQRQ